MRISKQDEFKVGGVETTNFFDGHMEGLNKNNMRRRFYEHRDQVCPKLAAFQSLLSNSVLFYKSLTIHCFI